VLRIQRVNPLDVADSLRSFFANENQALATLVDSAYPEVARRGGASWIGVDDTGHVQLNCTLCPHDFQFRGRTVRGGMLANTVASKNYRWFFPTVSLVKQLVQDVTREAELDFLYTDPQPSAAVVSKAAGLEQIGALDRFVIPLSDSARSRAIAAHVYSAALRLRLGFAARCAAIDSRMYDVSRIAESIGTSSRLQPHHSDSLYRRRLHGYPGSDYVWCEFRLPSHRKARDPDAAVLLQGPDERKVVHVWAIRRRENVALRPLIPGLLKVARERGGHRLEVEAVQESDLAHELRRTGFRTRDDLVPVFGKGITPAGTDVVNAIHDWEITALDMDR
jgi:hypothetical protein